MITIQEAYLLAKHLIDEHLRDCIDLGSSWAFYLSDSESSPGVPYIQVDKHSGEIHMLYVPPISNLRILSSGTHLSKEKLTELQRR